MADEDKVEGQEGQAETPPAAPEPKFVTSDQLSELNAKLNGQFEQINHGFQALLNAQRQGPAPAPMVEEDLDEALAGGEDVGSVLKKAMGQLERRIVNQYIAPIQNEGMKTIAQLSERVVRGEMPYYDLLKDKMAPVLSGMDPALSMKPEVIKHVYDNMVGQNITKIVGMEIEKQIRAKVGGGKTQDTGETGRVTGSKERTFDDVFGKESLDAIRHLKGNPDPDEFAKRLGYKDAKDYLAKAIEMETTND
jgi:hypothetical protein